MIISEKSYKFVENKRKVIHPSNKLEGLLTCLDKLMSEYEFQEEMHDDLKIEIDVINPKLAQILKTKYGFKVLQKIGPDRVIMGL